jgi:hypothetical protein
MPEEPPRHGVTKDAGAVVALEPRRTPSGDSRERNELVCDRERELTVRVHIHKISVEVEKVAIFPDVILSDKVDVESSPLGIVIAEGEVFRD